nr:hypothetical protein [Mycoplasmopsis bovis]
MLAHNNPAAKNDRVESNAFVNVKGIISWLIKNIALISAIEITRPIMLAKTLLKNICLLLIGFEYKRYSMPSFLYR